MLTSNDEIRHASAAVASLTSSEASSSGPDDRPVVNLSMLKPPIQGNADWRQYRCFQMPNGVTVCLVHDRESITLAAAATVKAGSALDPRQYPGLAHFAEHMVFLGSGKYPGENEYKAFLAQHGGRSNASTSLHSTTFKFEILAPFGDTALDMFSQFFVDPLFSPSGTARQVHAVDAENSKNLTSDERRRLQVLKALASPRHYFSKFTTGNEQTLLPSETHLEQVREALLAFHSKHYRPENLTLVVAGPQPLDELQGWVIPKFATMLARSFPSNPDEMSSAELLIHEAADDAPPFGYDNNFTVPHNSPFLPALHNNKKWPVLVTNKPIRSMRLLALMFVLPSVQSVPDQSPSRVLGHLLGHEGPNSSFAVLQNDGLITGLSAGLRISAPDFSLFQISIALTKSGEQRWKDVVQRVFEHCQLIGRISTTEDGMHELRRIWGEKAKLDQMFFHYTPPAESVYSLAPSLCANVVLYGTEKALTGGRILQDEPEVFPQDLFTTFASRLVPSNCIIERCSLAAWNDMENAGIGELKTEQWYGVNYYLSSISSKDVSHWDGMVESLALPDSSAEIKLPEPNRFIPRSLALCPNLPDEARLGPRLYKAIDPPNLLVEDNSVGRLWHRLDDRYALPKSVLEILVRNAAVEYCWKNGAWSYESSASVHSSLLVSMFAQALAQPTYDATLSGLGWNLTLTTSGIRLSCRGFSDRVPDLAVVLLQEFVSGSFIQQSFFDSAKDRMLRNLNSFFESRRADSHAIYYRDFLLSSLDEGVDDAIASADKATLDSTRCHHQSLMANEQTFVEFFFTGNVSENQARDLYSRCAEILTSTRSRTDCGDLSKFWQPGLPERCLLPGQDIELHFASRNSHEQNGAALITFQSPVPGFRGHALSSKLNLQSTAALRLLCHIVREPLFDELRTKQALGYIVDSHYDVGISCLPGSLSTCPVCVPVDYVVISVLSRKVAPPELASRIDHFLERFRENLSHMADSEIENHAIALSKKLLKPIQELQTEASNHFSTISRHAFEVLGGGGTSSQLPWNNAKPIAEAVQHTKRNLLLEVWDRTLLPQTRSRLVSLVYGSTFPLVETIKQGYNNIIANDLQRIKHLRQQLSVYDNLGLRKPYFRVGWWSHRPYLTTQAIAGIAIASVATCVLLARHTKMVKVDKK